MIMRKKDYPKGKLARTTLHTCVLQADGWSNECPFRQTVAVEGIGYSNTVDLLLDEQFNKEEHISFQRALIVSEMQGVNSITVKAYGRKPTIDLPLLVAVETIEEMCKAGA